MFATYGFPKCVGVVYVTLLFLQWHPLTYGEDFNTRKGGYELNCLIVCDDNCHILGYLCGFWGSTHS